jgi:hypothetical protein
MKRSMEYKMKRSREWIRKRRKNKKNIWTLSHLSTMLKCGVCNYKAAKTTSIN